MPEPRVIRHRAEDVDVGGLRFEIDGELLEAGAPVVVVAPRVVERAEQRARACRVPDVAELPHPVGEHAKAPAHPGGAVRGEQERRALGRGRLRERDGRVFLETEQAPIAEAGVWHVRLGLLPARVAVVVVEPDAVDGECLEQRAKRPHPLGAVAVVGRADALPAVGRGRHPPVGADRRGVRMGLQVPGHVQGVELRVRLHLLRPQPGQPLCGVAARAKPDRIDAEFPQASPAVDDLLRNAAVDAAQRHPRRLCVHSRAACGGGHRQHGPRPARQLHAPGLRATSSR